MNKFNLIILAYFYLSFVITDVSALSTPAIQQDTQIKNAELQKLENQLEKLKEASDSAKIEVKGNEEDSGKIKITLERQVPERAITKTQGVINKTKTKKEKLPTVDLSKIEISDGYINEKLKSILPVSEIENPMCGTIPSVKIAQLNTSGDYIVLEDYIYDTGSFKITISKGFKYDRASIPRIFWAIVDKDDLGNVAPLIHDLLYRNAGILPQDQVSPHKKFSRDETDLLFYKIMVQCGVNKYKAELAYLAVSKFAKPFWKMKE